MHGEPATARLLPGEPPRAAAEYLARLLARPADDHPDAAALVADLAAAYGATAAGLALWPDGTPVALHPGCVDAARPWQDHPDLLARFEPPLYAAAVPHGDGTLLAALVQTHHEAALLWLHAPPSRPWTQGDAAALALAGQTLARWLAVEHGPQPRWAARWHHAACQQRLEHVARAVRRLAHDFGNVLTGILGFGELALAEDMPPDAPLRRFLHEAHAAARGGARFTQRLRLFAGRSPAAVHAAHLAPVLAEEANHSGSATLRAELPADLPPVALDADRLRQLLAPLLDNAREAAGPGGAVTVAARRLTLTADDAGDLYGDARPGPHVEVTVRDSGPGLSDDARRRLFHEPFFTTKPGGRGYGLAVAYGLAYAHRGGLALADHPAGGTVARLVLPVAPVALRAAPDGPRRLVGSAG